MARSSSSSLTVSLRTEPLDSRAIRPERSSDPDSRQPGSSNSCWPQRGLAGRTREYVARMDAHTVYPDRYLQRGVARLERGGVDWVTGPQIPTGRGRWSEGVALALRSWIGRGESDKWPGAVEQGGAADDEFDLKTSVFVGVWRRDTLDRLGGWDEGWPVNQDSEMAARVIGLGGRIVCRPDMGAEYVPRDTLRGLARQYGRYGYFRAKTFLRHPHSLPKSRWFPVAVLGSFLATLVPSRRLRRLGSIGAGAYLAGVLGISARAARTAGRDATVLPPIFVVMHLSWAVGFLLGMLRWLPRRSELVDWPASIERPDRSDAQA